MERDDKISVIILLVVLFLWDFKFYFDEGKRSLGRPRRRCEDNIKMDFQEVVGGGFVGTGWRWLRIGTGGSMSYDRSKASSKVSSPYSAISFK
jgi:hypothetical protein